MIRVVPIVTEGRQRAGTAWQRINTQPSWVVKASIIAFALVIGVPLLLLVLAAVLVGTLVFLVMLCMHSVWAWFRGAVLPRRDGRENVRVIRRVDGP